MIAVDIYASFTHEDPTRLLHSIENRSVIETVEIDQSVDHRAFGCVIVLALIVVHVQHRLKPERTHALVQDRVAPLQDIVDVIEALLDRIDVPQPKSKRAAVCHELWVLK